MNHLKLFEQYRDYMFAIAYRMLGSVMGAEDAVQEAYLRWEQVDLEDVNSPKSYLATIVTRLCLDQLKSAQAQREEYIGPWLPEPLVADPTEGPAQVTATADSLSMAFLVLLETLTPEQRAIYLLREVFDFEYSEIAGIVGKSEAACRKTVSRARQYIQARRPVDTSTIAERKHVIEEFISAVNQGDIEELLDLLDAEVVWTSDGGGTRGVARRPVEGRENVARFALSLADQAPPGTKNRRVWINGKPAILIEIHGDPYAVLDLEIKEGRIQAVYAVVNPEKLRHLLRTET